MASEQIFNNIEYAPAPTMAEVETVVAPPAPRRRRRRNNNGNNKREKCSKAEINSAYNKYGIRGFNNIL